MFAAKSRTVASRDTTITIKCNKLFLAGGTSIHATNVIRSTRRLFPPSLNSLQRPESRRLPARASRINTRGAIPIPNGGNFGARAEVAKPENFFSSRRIVVDDQERARFSGFAFFSRDLDSFPPFPASFRSDTIAHKCIHIYSCYIYVI